MLISQECSLLQCSKSAQKEQKTTQNGGEQMKRNFYVVLILVLSAVFFIQKNGRCDLTTLPQTPQSDAVVVAAEPEKTAEEDPTMKEKLQQLRADAKKKLVAAKEKTSETWDATKEKTAEKWDATKAKTGELYDAAAQKLDAAGTAVVKGWENMTEAWVANMSPEEVENITAKHQKRLEAMAAAKEINPDDNYAMEEAASWLKNSKAYLTAGAKDNFEAVYAKVKAKMQKDKVAEPVADPPAAQ